MYPQDGVLLDVSESGACIRVRSPQSLDESLAFVVRWNDESILLRGRMVRTALHRAQTTSHAELPRVEHRIAVEFQNLPEDSLERLRRLVRANA